MDQVPSHFEDGIQYAFDATTLTIAEECLRKYKYSIVESWEPINKSVHLKFGGHYATALEHYYKHRAVGMNHDDALAEVVWQALKDTWEYAYEPDGSPKLDYAGKPIGAPWMSPHPSKTRENLIRSIVWYCDEFGDHDNCTTVMRSDGTPAVEYSFQLDIDDGNVLCGHIDRVVDFGGQYYVMDQKTTGSTISEHSFKKFKPNTQMSLYTFAGRAIYNMPVKGVIIDMAQIAVGFTRFQRGFTFRTDSELDEWYEGAMGQIKIIQEANANGVYPMNPSSCDKYDGCQFREVCNKSPEVRDRFLHADFKRRTVPWNPLRPR